MTPASPRRRAPAVLTTLIAAAALAANTACEGPAAIAYLITGEDKNPALYDLDPDAPTLIWVEDDQAKFSEPNAGRTIAAVAGQQLVDQNALDQEPIDPATIGQVQSRYDKAQWRRMNLGEIARAANAQQLVYARVASVSAGATAGIARPQALLEVRVVDAATGRTLFPEPVPGRPNDEQGHTVVVKMDAAYEPGAGRATQSMIEAKLAQEAGVVLARVFHDWRPPVVDEAF